MKTKTFTISLILLATSWSQARVSDFNNLIRENIKAQDSLHQEVKGNVNLVKKDLHQREAPAKLTVVETDAAQFSAPSRKMKFTKEVQQFRPSARKQLDRTANEFSEAEQDF